MSTGDTSSWPALLDGFTQRHAGRRMVLEEEDPQLGLRRSGIGYPLRGAAYDRRDHRVAIMLGEQGSVAAHLTRTILRPAAVELLHSADGRESGLRVVHGAAQTVLRFSQEG